MYIELEVRDRVARIALNRPDKLNAMNEELLAELSDTIAALETRDDVSCLLVYGNGRAFSAGYDVSPNNPHRLQQGASTASQDWRHIRSQLKRWTDIWDYPKPVVVAIHGYCAGGATVFAACADITIVEEDTKIQWPSLPTGGGMLSPVSEWLIGPKKAKELAFIRGSHMTGREAAALQWANHAVPAGTALPFASQLAHQISRMPLELLMLKKRALNRIMDIQGFRESIAFGAEWDAIAHTMPGSAEILKRVRENGLQATIRELAIEEAPE
jgi:enoyl-CoA hydratase